MRTAACAQAVLHKQKAAVRLLLEAGAKLDVPNAYFVTPAQLAARLGVELTTN